MGLKKTSRSTISKATPLADIMKLAPPCSCTACSHGCTMGSGMLAGDDAKRIAKFLGITEAELKEKFLEEQELLNKKMLRPKLERNGKPYGKCTFYDEKRGCTVHEVKPLQCRISIGCRPYSSDLTAWFTLNYVLDSYDPEAVRQYADYIASGGHTIQGGKLEEIMPDKKKRKEILGFKILK